MKEVTEIEFVFENVEFFSIDAKYIGTFLLDGITESIRRDACNSISRYKIVKKVCIEIFKEGDGEYSWLGGVEKKFDRLRRYNDIVSVVVHYSDHTEEGFYVDYSDAHDETNDYQTTRISNQGNLYIVINAKETIDDVFPGEIDDPEYAEMRKRAFGIEDKGTRQER